MQTLMALLLLQVHSILTGLLALSHSTQAFATEPDATDELLNDVVGVFVVAFDTRHGELAFLKQLYLRKYSCNHEQIN